jgi:hypothetical protein
MNSEKGIREIKKEAKRILGSPDFEKKKEKLLEYSPRRVINPLISFLCSGDTEIFHRSTRAIGMVVDSLARTNMEEARVVMRRFMWMLNDESGGIGWGVPESMAEVMVRNQDLAEEFSNILISYLDEEGNFLEYAALQRGLLRGAARVAEARPHLMKEAAPHLYKYFRSPDPVIRFHAARIAGLLAAKNAINDLRELEKDDTVVKLFERDRFLEATVGSAARSAMERIESSEN